MGVRVGLMVALGGCLAAALAARGEHSVGTMLVYVGGQSRTRDGGIHRFGLDMATGKLAAVGATTGVGSPTFLIIHPSGRFLYAVNERGRFRGKPSGSLSAFAIDPATGDLSPLNQEATGGPGPCHLTVDKAGRHVLAANYSGGSVCVLPVADDGRLGKASAFVQHQGSSVHPQRQKSPHAHSINLDAANRFAVVADLGLDKVLVYRFDPARGSLTPNDPPCATLKPGSGPRHLAFHPNGRFAYVINELDSTVTAFAYDAEKGTLATLETLTTLPEGFQGSNATAEVLVHPSGKFLYGSNRGHNSIVVYTLDPRSGKPALVEHEPVQGDWPRNFNLDPTGTWLIAANRRSNSLVVFGIDPASGALTPTGHTAHVLAPACVKFLRLGR